MPSHRAPWWACCSGRCWGIRLDASSRCFAHAGKDRRAAVLEELGAGRPLDFTRGVWLTEDLLEEILAAAPRDDDRIVLNEASCELATLEAADFSGVIFQGLAHFGYATFQGATRFDSTAFQGRAWFESATFQADTWFPDASFEDATFDSAVFQGAAEFGQSTFHGDASFSKASFGEAEFVMATFEGDTWFDRTTFDGEASFPGARFQAGVWFSEATFHHDANFTEATFERGMEQWLLIHPFFVAGKLYLDHATLPIPLRLTVAAQAVSCRGTRFPAGGHLRVACAEITFEDAEIPVPLIVSEYRLPPELTGSWERLVGPQVAARRASLVSLQRADVAGLVVTGVELRKCHFSGAHHLDRFQITTPAGFYRVPSGPLGDRRGILAEECAWRRQHSRRRHWQQTAQLSDSPLLEQPRLPEPAELAGLYRLLRKGQEDAKNEPGAADLYYGEMEMRRHSDATPPAERLILCAYWLIAGYGLRASRALATLALVVTGSAVALQAVGFQRPLPTFWASLLYAVQSTVSLEGKARQLSGQLTLPGDLLRTALRLLGPLLLGLALLSVRNRVKR